MTSDGPRQSRNGAESGRQDTTPIVLVDGSNVAHSSEAEQPSLADIVAVCDKLRGEGYEPVVVVDAALRHQIDDRPAQHHPFDTRHGQGFHLRPDTPPHLDRIVAIRRH